VLSLSASQYEAILATCIRALPQEGCGLLVGDADGLVREVVSTHNIAASAALYEVEPLALLKASRRAESMGVAVIGVFHSHTHTDAYPSETDIRQAPDPNWHYVLVSLRVTEPVLRSYRIVEHVVDEEEVRVSVTRDLRP
jgi:proteasome lid subunit RPN8/RPN11